MTDERTYMPGSPVIDDYLADPFVFRHEQTYYAIGTGREEAHASIGAPGAAEGELTRQPSVFPMHASTDLMHWRPCGRALIRPDPALGGSFWAPEIAYDRGTFYMYYSVGWVDRLHHLRVATSTEPLGPYLDAGVALTSVESCPFAIDPHPFLDKDGRWYLFHARDFLTEVDEQGRQVRPGTALVVHELTSMLELSEHGTTVLRARWGWQRFLADRLMYGQLRDWHTLEGPSVVEHAGRYHCFYSGGRWDSDHYGVDYAVATSVLGPYDDTGAREGPRLLATEPGGLIGPGHMSLVQGPDGVSTYIAYHAWDKAMTTRRCHIDALEWTRDGPVCRAMRY